MATAPPPATQHLQIAASVAGGGKAEVQRRVLGTGEVEQLSARRVGGTTVRSTGPRSRRASQASRPPARGGRRPAQVPAAMMTRGPGWTGCVVLPSIAGSDPTREGANSFRIIAMMWPWRWAEQCRATGLASFRRDSPDLARLLVDQVLPPCRCPWSVLVDAHAGRPE